MGRLASLLLMAAAAAPLSSAACSSNAITTTSAFSSSSAVSACSTYTATTNSTSSNSSAAGSPVVDLPYALYAARATLSPDGRTYYNFSNVRYAAPPVGALRFQKPLDPPDNRTAGVQDGAAYGKICPQAYTPWQNAALVTAPPGEHESEDCLFLDVVVSADAWAARCNASSSPKPVIVWIHGGGFQIGAKYGTPDTNPLGLLDRSFEDDGEGIIWVGLNYRVSCCWQKSPGGYEIWSG